MSGMDEGFFGKSKNRFDMNPSRDIHISRFYRQKAMNSSSIWLLNQKLLESYVFSIST